jgi:hypothetical protein
MREGNFNRFITSSNSENGVEFESNITVIRQSVLLMKMFRNTIKPFCLRSARSAIPRVNVSRKSNLLTTNFKGILLKRMRINSNPAIAIKTDSN